MTVEADRIDSNLDRARNAHARLARLFAPSVAVMVAVASSGSALIASQISRNHVWQSLLTGIIALLCTLPLVVLVARVMGSSVRKSEKQADAAQSRLHEDGRHREFDSTIADALEMADSETEALGVIERAFAIVLPDQPVELLLADNSHAHMSRMAFTSPNGEPAGCGVSSRQECPAARRARTHIFPDSKAINACPKLDNRPEGACSAVCIPVSVMGRTVGVIHTTAAVHSAHDEIAARDLRSIANQAGAKLGMLRIMAETQLQASTDGLTGLFNRRAFDNQVRLLHDSTAKAAVAMADIDHFKQLNDTHGHDTGDRALRTFAETLRGSLRAQDVISRRGGEEFAIFFPGCDTATAAEALDRVRARLQLTLLEAGLPSYTVSFGVAEAMQGESVDDVLARADIALFQAKRAGRNQVFIHGQETAETEPAPLTADIQLVRPVIEHPLVN